MKVKFCGAAQTVTGSSHLLTLDSGYKILLDCGLYQGNEDEFEDFNSNWLFDPSDIDCVILSHAHIDHCGRIPKLVKDGFRGKIICTSATRDLCAIMLIDSAKIQIRDAKYINKKNKRNGLPETAKPLYEVEDVELAISKYIGISYGKWFQINDEASVILRDSGHIFGSASVTLKISQKNSEPLFFGFSGDIGRPNRPILKDPKQMDDLDYLICESTYGGEKHNDLPHDKKALLKVIKDTCLKRRGKLIIPAFSVGRTQEIVYMLDQLETDGKLPRIPVYVDSPLAVNATEIFQLHPECFDSEILEYMLVDPNPFGFNNLKYVRRRNESKAINSLKSPAIIISASGMMTGGRILHHLINRIEDSKNTILIVGYCSPNTLGGRIRNGDKKVRIFGVEKKVKAKVVIMDSYSAHGDQDEMIEYLSNLEKDRLKSLYLVHGDIDRQKPFRKALKNFGFNNVEIPELGQEYELN